MVDSDVETVGEAVQFVVETVSDPLNAAALAAGTVGVVVLLGLFTRGFSLVAFLLFTTTLFGLPDDPVLAHLSLYGLVSVLLITGSGSLALDNRFPAAETASERTSPAD